MLSQVCEKSYVAESRYANFYGGGDIAWSADGSRLFCHNGIEVCLVDVATGQVLRNYSTNSNSSKEQNSADDEENDPTYCFAVSVEHLVTAHLSGLLRLWEIDTGKLLKLWKSLHKGPVVQLAFSPCGSTICSSGSDSTLRFWDYAKNSCICMLNDFSGPASLLKFHPSPLKEEIYAVGADNVVYCWNYTRKKLIGTLRGHLSRVSDIAFHHIEKDSFQLTTVSRDKVLILWQLENDGEAKQLNVLPLYEELVGAACLSTKGQQDLFVLSANGKLQQINRKTMKVEDIIAPSDVEVSRLLHCPKNDYIAIVTTEQNILIYKTSGDNNSTELCCIKQLIGYNNEILDMCFLGTDDRYLAVATNSKQLKLYDTHDDMNCKLISGHKDTVMSLSSMRNLLLSTGKDHSIMLWEVEAGSLGLKSLVQQNNCHTATIGCIAFSPQSDNSFVTVSQDGSMKVWQLLEDKKGTNYSFGVRYAALAHDKEINCVSYSPNGRIIATASQDKTVKLWHNERNTTLGTLRGHLRGVSCVRFSPVDQIALTSSGDSTLRIWSISNFMCLKRIELECTVLRAEFIDHGKFIISAATDGVLKLWNIKTNACVQSIDEHTERVWCLAIPNNTNKYFYSGGSDSKLIRFADITQATRNLEVEKRQTELQQEQVLHSLLHQNRNLHKAFVLALNLGRPKTTYNIISSFVRKRNMKSIESIVQKLNADQRLTLFEHVKCWSTNSSQAQVSNLILQYLIKDALIKPSDQLYKYSHMVEVLSPYIQRHFKRVTELNKDLAYLDFIQKCM